MTDLVAQGRAPLSDAKAARRYTPARAPARRSRFRRVAGFLALTLFFAALQAALIGGALSYWIYTDLHGFHETARAVIGSVIGFAEGLPR